MNKETTTQQERLHELNKLISRAKDEIREIKAAAYQEKVKEHENLIGKCYKHCNSVLPFPTIYLKVVSAYATDTTVSVLVFPEKPQVKFVYSLDADANADPSLPQGSFELETFTTCTISIETLNYFYEEISKHEYNVAFMSHVNALSSLKFEVSEEDKRNKRKKDRQV